MHAATLHGELPPEEGAARFRIRISPSMHPLPDGNTALTYSAAIEPVVEPGEAPEAFRNPRAQSDEARAAADAVLGASSDDRLDRLLDLVSVLAP